ncbi:MAG: ribonuclease HII [Alphaproteobacteria bacterium]|nr:ribonuclease HII [Alphaproteobacteria bacterium]
MPDFALEMEVPGPVAGIDEVGRGPLAGPVLAAAVILKPEDFPKHLHGEVRDSKTLSAGKREAVLKALLPISRIGIGAASVREIDRLNILNATFLAMARAVQALQLEPALALVDGNRAPALACPVRTVVGGEMVSLSIAAASIVAKVTRDRLMVRLGRRHPGYGWERNAGYGTAAHREALLSLGVTPHHRLSFRPIPQILSHGADSDLTY